MKQYHVSNGDAYDAETKLKHAQDQKTKVESQANKASKKLKTLEKQVEKVRVMVSSPGDYPIPDRPLKPVKDLDFTQVPPSD